MAFPHIHTSKMVRGLMRFATRMEQLGEMSADMSSVFEKIALGLVQKDDAFSAKAILASATARYVTSLVSLMSMNGFKVVGAGFFFLSFVASVSALGMSHLGPYRIDQYKMLSNRPHHPSPQSLLHSLSVATRNRVLASYLKETDVDSMSDSDSADLADSESTPYETNPEDKPTPNRKEFWQDEPLSARQSSDRLENLPKKYNLRSLYQHRSECGPTTQKLLDLSHGIYKLLNKLTVSWDKHVAYRLGKKYGLTSTGQILGTRLAFLVTTAVSAVLGLALSQVGFALWQVGALACAAALVFGLLAVLIEKQRDQRLERQLALN